MERLEDRTPCDNNLRLTDKDIVRFIRHRVFQNALTVKREKALKLQKENGRMAEKEADGETVPYGQDYGYNEIFYKGQVAMLNELIQELDKI